MHFFSFRNILFLCGALHFCQLPAMLVAPKMLGWKEDLAKLTPINGWIFRVIAGGIMITVMGTGALVMVSASEIAMGGHLATALCAFLSVFWIYRGSIQIFLYSKIWLKGMTGRGSHIALSLLFSFQAAVYTVGFIRGIIN